MLRPKATTHTRKLQRHNVYKFILLCLLYDDDSSRDKDGMNECVGSMKSVKECCLEGSKGYTAIRFLLLVVAGIYQVCSRLEGQ
jgi:hypothetical protein